MHPLSIQYLEMFIVICDCGGLIRVLQFLPPFFGNRILHFLQTRNNKSKAIVFQENILFRRALFNYQPHINVLIRRALFNSQRTS